MIKLIKVFVLNLPVGARIVTAMVGTSLRFLLHDYLRAFSSPLPAAATIDFTASLGIHFCPSTILLGRRRTPQMASVFLLRA